MSSVAVALWSLIFVASASEEVKVRPGHNATLHCQHPSNEEITLIEWSKPELKSDHYVFFFQNQRSYENYQHDFFKGRVELRDPTMKDGDVSVILRNVGIRDTGTYECLITTSDTRSGERVVSEFKHSIGLIVTTSVQVNITAGETVILPCQAPNINSNPRAAVEWTKADLGTEYILFYRDKKFDPDEQHPSFVNRVDLQDRQMKDGDVSLTLSNVMTADSGTYECRVAQRGTNSEKRAKLNTDPICIINLSVVVPPGQPGGLRGDGGMKDGVSRRHPGLVAGVVFVVMAAFVIFLKLKLPPAEQQPV